MVVEGRKVAIRAVQVVKVETAALKVVRVAAGC